MCATRSAPDHKHHNLGEDCQTETDGDYRAELPEEVANRIGLVSLTIGLLRRLEDRLLCGVDCIDAFHPYSPCTRTGHVRSPSNKGLVHEKSILDRGTLHIEAV